MQRQVIFKRKKSRIQVKAKSHSQQKIGNEGKSYLEKKEKKNRIPNISKLNSNVLPSQFKSDFGSVYRVPLHIHVSLLLFHIFAGFFSVT